MPEAKVERYYRSLGFLGDALRHTHRAYLFDTSEETPWSFAEVTDGSAIDLTTEGQIPNWFAPVWSRFHFEPA